MNDDPLEGRVARFHEHSGNAALFLDTIIPGYRRTVRSIVGANVGEDRDDVHVIPADGFHLAVIEAEPGKGSALHTHTTVEVFMPLEGRWQIFYAEGEDREVVLDRWDVCSVPPGIWRGFRNAGSSTAHLLALVGGTDAGRLTWAPHVLEQAAELGARLDASGYRTSD